MTSGAIGLGQGDSEPEDGPLGIVAELEAIAQTAKAKLIGAGLCDDKAPGIMARGRPASAMRKGRSNGKRSTPRNEPSLKSSLLKMS